MARKGHHRSQSHDTKGVVDKGLQELLFKDAVQYSIFMTNQAYWRLHSDLLLLSKKQENTQMTEDQFYDTQISALTHAWQVVDSVHRLRTLLDRGPRLMRIPIKDTECIRFMKQTDVVEQMRHTIQHLDSKIFDFVTLKLPALGSLNWLVKLDDGPGFDTCTLVPGTIFERIQPIINPARMAFTPPIDKIMLISIAEVNLTDIARVQIPALAEWLNKTIGIDCGKRGQGFLAKARFVPDPAANTLANRGQLVERVPDLLRSPDEF